MLGLSNLKVEEKKKVRKQEICARSGRDEILGAIRRQDPERALGQSCRRRQAGLGPGADRASASQPEELRLGGVWGLAPRGGQAEKRLQAPEGSTLPSFTPSPSAVP